MPEQNEAPHRPRTVVVTLVVVFILALSVRLVYLYQIRDMGFFEQPVSDGLIYDQRAQGIAAGDWLGPADFVHAPLYAYFLGVIQVALGHDLLAVRLAQVLIGGMSCVLVVLAGRKFFDSRVALAAGLILACYPPAIFFDGLIQKTSLALFLSALLLWLLGRCRERPAAWPCCAAGLVLGLLALTRQNALALAPLVLAWLWLGSRAAPAARKAGWTLTCAVGFAAALLPWALRNKVVTGEFVLTTPNLGQNFAMGNHPQATGTYLPFKRGRSTAEYEQAEWVRAAERATGRTMTPGEVSDYYFTSALQWTQAHPGPWLRLMLKKTLMVAGAYEAPDTEDYYLYHEWSPLLRHLDRAGHFGVLCPLAVAGVVLTRSRWRELWLLYGWLVVTAIAVAAFVVFARYRFPLVPVLAWFAGAAVLEGAAHLRRRRFRDLVGPVVALVAAGLLVNWPVYHQRRTYPTSYTNHGAAFAAQGRYHEDLRELHKALTLDPDNVDAHLAMGNTLVQLEHYQQAIEHYHRARVADPDYGGVYRGLGHALSGLGRCSEAAEQYRLALRIDPQDRLALNGLAGATARQGRFAEAVELFAKVLQADPTWPEAHLNLGNTYLPAGRLDQAAASYQQALHLRPEYADALYNLGLVQMRRHHTDQAIDYLKRTLKIDPDHRDAQASLVAALIQTQRWDEAIDYIDEVLAGDAARTDLARLLETARRMKARAQDDTAPPPEDRQRQPQNEDSPP